MKTVVKKISDLTRDEYRYCYRANLDSSDNKTGRMREALSFYRAEPEIADEEEAKVILLWDDSREGAARMLGWAMTLMERNERIAWFWVKKPHRNKGYGTVMMQEVKKIDPKPKVFPWSYESAGFFSKFDIKVDSGKTIWLVNKPKVC